MTTKIGETLLAKSPRTLAVNLFRNHDLKVNQRNYVSGALGDWVWAYFGDGLSFYNDRNTGACNMIRETTDVPTPANSDVLYPYTAAAKIEITTAYTPSQTYNEAGYNIYVAGKEYAKYLKNATTIHVSFLVKTNKAGNFPFTCISHEDTTNLKDWSYSTKFTTVGDETWERIHLDIPLAGINPDVPEDGEVALRLTVSTLNGHTATSGYDIAAYDEWRDDEGWVGMAGDGSTNLWDTVGNYMTIADISIQPDEWTPNQELDYDIQLIRCMHFYQRYGLYPWGTILGGVARAGTADDIEAGIFPLSIPINYRTLVSAVNFTASSIKARGIDPAFTGGTTVDNIAVGGWLMPQASGAYEATTVNVAGSKASAFTPGYAYMLYGNGTSPQFLEVVGLP